MPETLDGHVQYNGTSWSFYLTKQPGLQCETPDCSTCKARSQEYMDKLSDEQSAENEKIKAKEKADVDAAAKQAAEDLAQAQRNEAGRRKSEALRLNGIRMTQRVEAAKRAAVAAISEADVEHSAKVSAAKDAFDAETSAAIAEQTQGEREIEAKDWLKSVIDEANAAALAVAGSSEAAGGR